MHHDQYIKKWLDGTLTDQERRDFEQTESYRELKKLSDSMLYFKAPEYQVESELVRFNKVTAGKAEGKVIPINWQKTLLRVAAMLTIVAGSYIYYMYFLPVTVETGIAERKEVLLPDSSEVILNAVSKITYSKRGWNKNRSLELEGEALFKVRKGATFDVITTDGLVSVLGTEFNVKQREGYFEVVCYEGLVQVMTVSETSRLPANHALQVLNGKVAKNIVNHETEPSWLVDESSFQSVPFREVLREFERQYDVALETRNIDLGKLFTGRFTHNDMILALQSITIPQNISYQVTGNQQIILTGEIE